MVILVLLNMILMRSACRRQRGGRLSRSKKQRVKKVRKIKTGLGERHAHIEPFGDPCMVASTSVPDRNNLTLGHDPPHRHHKPDQLVYTQEQRGNIMFCKFAV